MTNVNIDSEVKQAYAALGTQLATPEMFGSSRWEANSQYGYCLSDGHDTREEAEQAALAYYRERMNLIRQ